MTRRSRLLIVEGGGDNHALKTECRRGPYGKGEHSFKLLADLDPAKVRSASPAADALLTHPREAL